MWQEWSLRAKIVGLTVGVVLPIMVTTTVLTIRLSRNALEDDLRKSGLALARELAASAVERHGTEAETLLQREIVSLAGRGGLVRDVAVYAVGPVGLVIRAHAGTPEPPDANVEVAAREGQEIVVVKDEALSRLWRVTVPIWEGKRSVGAVSLALPLARADALAHQRVIIHQQQPDLSRGNHLASAGLDSAAGRNGIWTDTRVPPPAWEFTLNVPPKSAARSAAIMCA